MYVTRRTLLLTLCGWGLGVRDAQAFIRRIVSRAAGQAGAAGGEAVAEIAEVAAIMALIGIAVMAPILLIVELFEKACGVAGLSEEEKQELRDIAKTGVEACMKIIGDTPKEQWQQALLDQMQKLDSQFRMQIDNRIPAENRDKLRQVAWRLMGATGLSDPQVAGALELSEDQQSQVAVITKRLQQNARESLPERPAARLLHFGKLYAHREAALHEAKRLLDDDQNRRWEELQGDHISLRSWFGLGEKQPSVPDANKS